MFAAILLAASVSSANFCAKWQTRERYDKAITTLPAHRSEGVSQLCEHPGLLDVYGIYQYFIQDDNQTMHKSNCYSTF